MQLLLELEDAKVLAFDHPTKALSVAESSSVDVIISDIGLPGMDGHQFLAKLRKLDDYRAVPAIALTGYGAGEADNYRGEGRFDVCVGKPVPLEELTSVITKLVSSAR